MPNEAVVPTARAVASRALILHYAIERVAFTSVSGFVSLFSSFASEEERSGIASGVDEVVAVTIDVLKGLGLWTRLTPRERHLFEAAPGRLTAADLAQAAREADALVVLLWSLGMIEQLPDTAEATEGSALLGLLGEDEAERVEAFLRDALLRPEWELEAARDALASTQFRLGAGATDAAAVVATRLKALDWVCGSRSLREWDDAAAVGA